MPRLTILQLDTKFMRVPGDVACPDTYDCPIETLTIPAATVAAIVTDNPRDIDITGFARAMAAARGEVIVTSCGFLAPWQADLAALTTRPFISSALISLGEIIPRYDQGRLGVMTFDSETLSKPAYDGILAGFNGPLIGLDNNTHLRDVISHDLPALDTAKATTEICAMMARQMAIIALDAVILECTNLPPYKAALRARFGLDVYDILTMIDAVNPGLVKTEFL